MTNETKHTPGTWHRNIRANGKYPIIFAGRNQHVAQAVQQKDSTETEANIDLIAAAPELLEVLEEAKAHMINPYPAGDDLSHILVRAEAAIAKAKGLTKLNV